MTAVAPNAPAQKAPAEISILEIEASGRLPLVYLVAAGGFWLCLGLLLLLIQSLKLHMPGFLASSPFWTYGRIHDASTICLFFGFAVQWALAGAFWMLCHVGRAQIIGPCVTAIGAFIWNFAITLGVIAILCGESSGFDSLPVPAYLAGTLFAAYLLMAIPAALTFHERRSEMLYPSQWFVVGSLFWFPWVFSAASLLLLVWPVRGAFQDSIAWWFGHNFNTVFLGFAGLGPIFYFIPKFSARPLNSYQMAAFAFWLLALFGSWGGIPAGAALPAWIPSVSAVGTIFTSMVVLAVARNLFLTTDGIQASPADAAAARFIFAGMAFWILAMVQDIIGAFPSVAAVTGFTSFREAQQDLFLLGFFAMTLSGAIYYFLPRVLAWMPAASETRGRNAPRRADFLIDWSPSLVSGHFWTSFFGVLVCWLSLLIAGVWQGILLQDPANPFDSSLRSTLPAIRFSTLGILMLWIGSVLFLLNFGQMAAQFCRRCCANCDILGKARA
jgi:cytochrome c oxidase cbb3-type subunit 1